MLHSKQPLTVPSTQNGKGKTGIESISHAAPPSSMKIKHVDSYFRSYSSTRPPYQKPLSHYYTFYYVNSNNNALSGLAAHPPFMYGETRTKCTLYIVAHAYCVSMLLLVFEYLHFMRIGGCVAVSSHDQP